MSATYVTDAPDQLSSFAGCRFLGDGTTVVGAKVLAFDGTTLSLCGERGEVIVFILVENGRTGEHAWALHQTMGPAS